MIGKGLVTSVCFSAALALVPALSASAAVRECPAGKVTAASYTWNFRQEANGVFKDVQADAWRARNHADRMKSFADDADLGWQAYGNQLTQVKSAVDDMGKDVCRLESIRRALAPWQKHSVDRIATEVTLMADNTQDAIVFFNHHQGTLWRPKFETYVDNLYTQADDLTHSVGHAVQMAKVGPEYRELRHDMGVKASS